MNEDRHAVVPPASAEPATPPAAAPPTPQPTTLAPNSHEAHPVPTAPAPATVITPAEPAAKANGGFYHPETSKTESASNASSGDIDPADLADAEFIDDDQVEDDGTVLEWDSDDTAHDNLNGIKPAVLIAGILVLAGLIYLLTRDLVSTVAVAFAAFGLLFYNTRRPRQVHYRMDGRGITVDRREYAFNQFRSFAFEDDARTGILTLAPLQRFMPLLTVSYSQELHDSIVDQLSKHLPMEAHHGDGVDRMMRRFRL